MAGLSQRQLCWGESNQVYVSADECDATSLTEQAKVFVTVTILRIY